MGHFLLCLHPWMLFVMLLVISAVQCIDMQASTQCIFQPIWPWLWLYASVTSMLQAVRFAGVSSCQRLSCFADSFFKVINLQCQGGSVSHTCPPYATPLHMWRCLFFFSFLSSSLQCYKSFSNCSTPVRHAPVLLFATPCWHMLCTCDTSLS